MADWHTIPVFISSTFLDMQAERDVIVKRVFPSLRAKLEPYRVRIVEIDLRWGITSEQERSGKVLDLCLELIDKARPFFIGLLGERYGSVLNDLAPGVLERHSWLPQTHPLQTSVTELEVLYGVLNHQEQSGHALFYLRDPAPLKQVPSALRAILTDADEPKAANDSTCLESIALRFEKLGIADSKLILERWLAGEWPPLRVAEALSPGERLDLLKMRLRSKNVVRLDGYAWRFEGIRVRWNLVRLALPNQCLVKTLEAAAPDGVVTPEAFAKLAHEPQIVEFLREYGAVALGDLDDLARQVETDMLARLQQDERVQAAVNHRQSIKATGRVPTTPQQGRRILTWVQNVGGSIVSSYQSLPPEVANQIVEREFARSSNSKIKNVIDLWFDRRDVGGAEVGGLAEDWADERDQHARYAESRLSQYTRRLEVEREIKNCLAGSTGKFLAVTGASGAGKSAVLAKTSRLCSALVRRSPGQAVSHFIGASASSSELPSLIKRLCMELNLFHEEELDQLAVDVKSLAAAFASALVGIDPEQPCYVVIDALDQLDPAHEAHSLFWLPTSLPAHVHVVLSYARDVEDAGVERLTGALRLRSARFLDLDQPEYRLTDAQCREIIERVPSLVAKSLEPTHVAALLHNDATRNPLYLKVALEELRAFGTFRLLLARINEFKEADTPQQLFSQVIEGLKLDFETDVLTRVLTALAASRHGMRESELVELVVNELDDSQKQRHRDETAAILRHFQAYLHFRGGLLDFLHRSLRDAVAETFLKPPSSLRKIHHSLGHFFECLGRNADPPWSDWGKRGLAESLHHFLEAGDWDSVLRLVNDDVFVFRKGRSPYYRDLAQEWSRALVSAPAHYASAIAVAFARGGSQQLALAEVVGSVVLQTARLDERRFVCLGDFLSQKGKLWRGELLKAQALLIGIGLMEAAQTAISLVEASYDGDEPPDDGLAASYQQMAVLRNSLGEYDDGLQYADKSAELGRARNDDFRVAIADSTKVASLEGLGRSAEAAQLTKDVFARSTTGPGVGRVRSRAILSGFSSLIEIGEIEVAEKMLYDGLEECGLHSATEFDYASLASLLADHCILQSKPAEAIPTLRTALGMPASAYPDELRPNLYYLLFLCHAHLNHTNDAQSVLQAAADYPWSATGRQAFLKAFQHLIPPTEQTSPGREWN